MPHLVLLFLSCWFLAGCGTTEYMEGTPIHDKHAQRGYNKPYQIKGVWYHPQPHYEYVEEAKASYYGGRDVFHGRKTSTGEVFNMHGLSAAHKTLPLPCVVRVTNLENGRSLKLKVNDRGPFVDGRIIDVSMKAAKLLGFYQQGTAPVRVEVLVPESIHLATNYKPQGMQTPMPESSEPVLQASSVHVAHVEKPAPRRVPIAPESAPAATQPPARQPSQGLYAMGAKRYVQLKAIKNETVARNMARLLANKLQVPTKLMRRRQGAQATYYVFMGPLSSSAEAKNLLNNLRLAGQQGATIVNQ